MKLTVIEHRIGGVHRNFEGYGSTLGTIVSDARAIGIRIGIALNRLDKK